MDKRVIVIAGPNGAGKTTFAEEFLPHEAACLNFVNADLLAKGLSPFEPDRMNFKAGKLMIELMDSYIERGESFALETTLSGLVYLPRFREWKVKGYEIWLFFLKLPNAQIAKARVKNRIAEGGHAIPEKTIERRFARGWQNFELHYRQLAHRVFLYDATHFPPQLIKQS